VDNQLAQDKSNNFKDLIMMVLAILVILVISEILVTSGLWEALVTLEGLMMIHFLMAKKRRNEITNQ